MTVGIRAVRKNRIERVAVRMLMSADSPRLNGEDKEHIERLAEIGPDSCPPILVHLSTLRVIDGMHRLRAAVLRGQEEVEVEFFEGGEEEAFLIAVKENTLHGLPLTLADRRAAAARIIATHPFLSDRATAKYTGLSHKTVAAIRNSEFPKTDQDERVGVDGRTRPMSSHDGRRRALEFITSRPQAPLREIAVAAGISIGTAHDVRKRIERGADPVNVGVRPKARCPDAAAGCAAQPLGRGRALWRTSTAEIFQSLARDPKLKYTEAGRFLLRWLSSHAIGLDDWRGLIGAVPPHRVVDLAVMAQQCAEAWRDFSQELAQHEQQEPAARLAMRITILGAGVIGLSCAIDLARAGHSVTVIAADSSPGTNSDCAGAIFLPLLNSDARHVSAEYENSIARWTRHSWARFSDLVQKDAGVRYIRNHELFRSPAEPPVFLSELFPRMLATDDSLLPAGYTFRWTFTTLAIETPAFMPWLTRSARALGVALRTTRIATLEQIAELPADAVVNCSGLGAKELFADPLLTAVKGQMLLHDPVPIEDAFGAEEFGVLPRADACALGSLFQHDFETLRPTARNTELIWAEISRWQRVAQGGVGLPPNVLERSRIRRVVAGARPFRPQGVRLELDEVGRMPVIHNYGHGASGFTLSWGCAREVCELAGSL